MKYAIIIAALLAVSPALAQSAPSPCTLDLTVDQANTLRSLAEATIKQMGVQGARVLLPIVDKIDAAVQKVQDTAKAADEAAKIKAAVDAAKAAPPK